MSQKRAKQPRPKQMSDAVKMASYMADPSFVWHMVDMDSDEDGPVTLCGIGTHAGAKRGWRALIDAANAYATVLAQRAFLAGLRFDARALLQQAAAELGAA
jgi:hypothetical protein